MDNQSHFKPSVRLTWVDGETTQFVGAMLREFMNGNRVQFLCESGTATAVIQRIRIRLTRARNNLEANEIPRDHFRLGARSFPYTNSRGNRYDCVVLEKIQTQRHEMKSRIEGIVYGKSDRHAGQKESAPVRAIPEW